MNTILQDLIEHHIWANETLLTFCEGLAPEQLALTVPGTFGEVEATLAHLAANEEGYLSELGGVGVGPGMRPTIFNGETPRTLAGIRPVLARTAEGWRAVVREWPQNAVKAFSDEGVVERMAISVVVTQVVEHGTEHRTHIRTILAAHGIARDVGRGTTEPDLSAWAWHESGKGTR